MLSKLAIAPIIGVLFAVLAAFKIGLPATVTEPAVLAAVMLVIAAVTAFQRFRHGEIDVEAKAWYLSRIIWTQLAAALFAVLALFGIVPAIGQQGAVEAALAVAGLVSWFLAGRSPRPIG